MRFLLDTNVISELVRPVPDPNVVARFDQHRWASAIAAIAATLDLVLVTRNTRDFDGFDVHVVDWTL